MKTMNKATGVVVLGLMAVAAILAAMAVAASTPEPPQGRVCFPAAKWDAVDGDRPCVEVVRLYEDGSARVVQRNARNTVRVACALQNPAEVVPAGLYKVSCVRTR